jgi:uncharacterized GH25 family protein
MNIQDQGFLEIIVMMLSGCFMFFFGHNLWLVHRDKDDEIKIEAVTSDTFPESDSAVKLERVASFRFYDENSFTDIENFEIQGNVLVGKTDHKDSAPAAALELYPHPIVLEAAKFANYIKSEDAENLAAPQFISGETIMPQRESYAKFAKVLLENGDENFNVFTKKIGHRLEIIPAEMPQMGNLRVQVLFEGNPIGNLRVSAGAENLNGGKYSVHTRTDEYGFAEVEITQNGHWFLRTFFIRPHSDKENYEWESFWASITFRV